MNPEEIIVTGICPVCGETLTHNDMEPILKQISCPSGHILIDVSYKLRPTKSKIYHVYDNMYAANGWAMFIYTKEHIDQEKGIVVKTFSSDIDGQGFVDQDDIDEMIEILEEIKKRFL